MTLMCIDFMMKNEGMHWLDQSWEVISTIPYPFQLFNEPIFLLDGYLLARVL